MMSLKWKKEAFFHVLINLKNYEATIANPNKEMLFNLTTQKLVPTHKIKCLNFNFLQMHIHVFQQKKCNEIFFKTITQYTTNQI